MRGPFSITRRRRSRTLTLESLESRTLLSVSGTVAPIYPPTAAAVALAQPATLYAGSDPSEGPVLTAQIPDETIRIGHVFGIDLDQFFTCDGGLDYTLSNDTDPAFFQFIVLGQTSPLPNYMMFGTPLDSAGGSAALTVRATDTDNGNYIEDTFNVTAPAPVPAPIAQRTGAEGLQGAAPVLTGAITVGGGATLGVSNSDAIAPGTTVTIGDGGTLVLNMGSGDPNFVDSGTVTLCADTTAGTLNDDIELTRGGTLDFDNASDQTFSNAISGIGNVVEDGTDTLTFSGANTYTGDTRVQDGTLQIATGGSLPSSTNVILGNAMGDTSGILMLGDGSGGINQTVASLTTAGNGTSNAVVSGSPGGPSTLTIDNNVNDTFSGCLGGDGAVANNLALTMAGSSTLILTSTNTYTGPTTVTAGTLDIGGLPNSEVSSAGGQVFWAPRDLSVSPTPTSCDDDNPMIITGSFSEPGTPQADTVYVDWGDGTVQTPDVAAYPQTAGAPTFSIPAHEYAAAGTYTINMWVQDPYGGSTPVATLQPVAYTPSLPNDVTLNPIASIEEGDATDLSGTFIDPRAFIGDTVTIDWGDGTTSAADITTIESSPGLYGFQADPHFYDATGTYPIKVTVTNDAGSVAASTSETVNFTPPSGLHLTLSPATIAEGDDTVLTGNFTDPRDQVGDTVTIDWGDGTGGTPDITTMTLDPTAQGFTADPETYDTAGNYTVTVTVANDAGSTLPATTVATVLPVVAVVADVPTAAESGQEPGEFTISREDSGGTGDLVVPYALTETTANYTLTSTAPIETDYQHLTGQVTIPAGQTEATIVVNPLDTGTVGNDTSVNLAIGNSAAYVTDGDYANATVTIHENDLPTVKLTVASDAFTISVENNVDHGELVIPYTLSGTAANGNDYGILPGDVVLPATAMSVSIPVGTLQANSPVAGAGSVTLTLASSSGDYATDSQLYTATVSLLPVVSVYSTAPFSSMDQGELTIARSGPTADSLDVSYTTWNGMAANGDGPQGPYQIEIPAGSASVTLPVTPTLCAGSSSVAQLAVGLNPSADYIVSAIDGSYLPGDSVYPTDGIPGVKCAPTPLVAVYASKPVTAADRSPGEFTFELNQSSSTNTTIYYEVDPLVSSAVPGTDYAPITDTVANGVSFGRVTIYANETTAEVEIVAMPNSGEADRTVTIELATPDGGMWGEQNGYAPWFDNAATVTIADDTPELTVSDAVVLEGGNETFTVTLSQEASTNLTVPYSTSNGSGPGAAIGGVDYTGTSHGSIEVSAGATTATITVPTMFDALDDGEETFSLSLGSVTGVDVTSGQATGVILPVAATGTIRADFNGDGVVDATDDFWNAIRPTPVGEEGVANRTEVDLTTALSAVPSSGSGGWSVAITVPSGMGDLEFWDSATGGNQLLPSGPDNAAVISSMPSSGDYSGTIWMSATSQNITSPMSISLEVVNNTSFVATQVAGQAVAVPTRNQLSAGQQMLVDNAKSQLATSGLPPALQQVRLDVIIAAMTGTVTTTHPEGRNPNLWDDSSGSYVAKSNSTAVAAIDDLWIVHGTDGINFNLGIFCKPYSSLIMAEAYIMYFNSTGHSADVNQAGIAKINSLIGHDSFPGSGNREAQFEGVLWNSQSKKNAPAGGYQNLVPGDQVWFQNPYFDLGKPLAIAAGKDVAGEEGSNVFYLGIGVAGQKDCMGKDEGGQRLVMSIYDKKIYTVADYQQHIIDVFDTVQAWQNAGHIVVPGDFKIMRVRSVVDPSTL